MLDKTMLKLGPLVGIFIGRPAITVAGAISGVIPALAVAGVVGAGIYLAGSLLSSGEQDPKLLQKW